MDLGDCCTTVATRPDASNPPQRLVDAYKTILECVEGDEELREDIQKTPMRAAKAMLAMTSGYMTTLAEASGGAVFEATETSDAHPLGLVVVRDICIHSLCEHHLLPFSGRVHIGYLPRGGAVLGLSKLARIADMYSRRLQMQERLTQQIGGAIEQASGARGVAVMVECTHTCMCMRGVRKDATTTCSTDWRGAFAGGADTLLLRDEFWRLVEGGRPPPTSTSSSLCVPCNRSRL